MARKRKRLEVCQYYRYALGPEVSSPLGSGVSNLETLETESAQWWADTVQVYTCMSKLPYGPTTCLRNQ